jgi:dephospho-CoA kinase
MPAFLVTGNPGSGKTAMALELRRRGFPAIDADELAGWETADGEPAAQPEHATEEWLLSHRWVWGRRRVEEVVGAGASGGGVLFVCGIAVNQRDLLDLFDAVFLLSLDDATQIERLDTSDNADRNAAQRAQILAGRPVFERQMRAAGAVVLDGRLPTAELAGLILAEVGIGPAGTEAGTGL